MPNVWDGIKKMDNEQLSSQLASLKTVTMSNVFSEIGQKASNKTVKVFNGIRKIFNASAVKEPEVVPLDKRIANCKASLDLKSRETLLNETREVLKEKLKSANIHIEENPSNDALSVAVIEAACKNFKSQIDDELTPAQKADAVYQRYNERLISQTRKKYEASSEEEKRKISAQMQSEIESMSTEQKEELKKALGIEKLTGETLAKFISTSAGATALMLALNASGFGAFMALTTIIHAVFTTTLGITVPFAVYTTSTSILSFFLGPAGWIIFASAEIFMLNHNKNKIIYELLAQVVWASVLNCGGRLTPAEESLPSWLPEEERKNAISDNLKFMKLQDNYEKLKARFDSQAEEIKQKDEETRRKENVILSLKNKIVKQESKIQQAESAKKNVEKKLDSAKLEYEKYKQYSESQDETLHMQYLEAKENYSKAQSEINEYEQEIKNLKETNQESQDLISLYEDEVDKINDEREKLKSENDQMKGERDRLKADLDRATEKNEKKLKERWEKAFYRFEFEPGTIKYVVKNYQYNEYGYIESKLMELHEAKDPAAITSNRGKLKGENDDYHLGFSTSSGFPSRISYKPLKNNSNGKTIAITNIYKHNDPRFGK